MSTLTKRPVSEGAERWLFEEISVLDYGKVVLVDYMGNDLSVEAAARISYGQGTRRTNETVGLIRYLLRHWHTTPFEMIELKFMMALPIFVARQLIRHRTASVNEYSARYSVVPDIFYVPEAEVIALQSVSNKQGRGNLASPELAAKVQSYVRMDANQAFAHYSDMIDEEVARELARVGLPVATYTQWFWKMDLHNLMHFLRLRLDSHAQYEIRVFAEAIGRIVEEAYPIAWQAFVDYQLEAAQFSRLELDVLRQFRPLNLADLANALALAGLTNQRERQEAVQKLNRLGLIHAFDPSQRQGEIYLERLGLKGKERERELVFLNQQELFGLSVS
jgi:thymidylate synthase (FAD)